MKKKRIFITPEGAAHILINYVRQIRRNVIDIALKSSESISKVNKTKLSVLKPVKITTTTICNRQTGREISEKLSKIAHYISLG